MASWGASRLRCERFVGRRAHVPLATVPVGHAEQERARAHERQELLIAELNHRVRNILALIRGLISQSRQSRALSVEDFIGTLESRIHALARAHDPRVRPILERDGAAKEEKTRAEAGTARLAAV